METLVHLLGISFVSGINLYATVLVVGLAQHFGLMTGLPDELQILSHPAVMIAAGVMYLLEFVADKIPGLSIVWDGVHTFIRPLGASLLALGVAADLDPMARALAALAAGSIALGSHSAKAGLRLMAHTAPEPASFSVISLIEDAGVVGLLALVYAYPWAALVLLIALIVGTAIVVPMLYRVLRFVLGCAAGAVRGWFSAEPPLVPTWLHPALEHHGAASPRHVARAYVSAVPGLPRFAPGYFVVHGERTLFAGRRVTGTRIVTLAEAASRTELSRRILCDVVTFTSADGRITRVCLPKNESARLRMWFSTPQASTVPDPA